MSEAVDAPQGTTLEFPCKSCGAKLAFAPGAAKLKCGYCDYTEAVPQSAEAVEEHAFEDYKAQSTGWDTQLKRYDCQKCGARTEVQPEITSYSCAFCGSNQVVPQEQSTNLHKPESVLPFQVDQKRCIEEFKKWIASLWFRPSALKKQAKHDRLRGVYLPFWTYDALTASWWTAQAGYHYYEKDSEGKRVRKTRWESAAGDHHEFFDDVLIQASPSVAPGMVKDLEPFDTSKLVPYQPDYLSGMAAEDYRRDMPECWIDARAEIDTAIYSACARKVPGDTHRMLNVTSTYLNKTYKLCLLPIWIASYRYNEKPFTYVVNGQTGEVTGSAPYSWVKITLAVLAVLAIIGAIMIGRGV